MGTLNKKKAIYPGTFDPITNGHLDIVRRASQVFDEVIMAVSCNPRKSPFFTVEERMFMIRESIHDLTNVSVDTFDGLLVRYAKSKNAGTLIRGLREVSDFEYEFQMTLMNRKQMPDVETVFLMANEAYTYINSSIVKEIAMLDGEIKCFLPEVVVKMLAEKMRE
jgi:pantetheine-phosphate adenylyltransferase